MTRTGNYHLGSSMHKCVVCERYGRRGYKKPQGWVHVKCAAKLIDVKYDVSSFANELWAKLFDGSTEEESK